MNICIVSDLFDTPYGGPARIIKHTLSKLLERGHYVTIITSKYNNRKSFERKKNLSIYRFHSILVPKSQKEFSITIPNIKKIQEIYKKEKIEVIHFHIPSPLTLTCTIVAKRMNLPIIATHHLDSETFFSNLVFSTLESNKFFYKTLNLFYNQTDSVIVPSQYKANLLKKYGLKKNPIVVSNGISLSEFNGNLSSNSSLEDFELNERTKNILFVGRLMKEKGIDVLIRAFSIVNSQIPETKLIIVGKGYLRKDLEKLVKDLNLKNIVFTGFISDYLLKQTYASSNVLVLPSYAESQSLVLLEAAAMGLPLIGANTTAIPELVINGWNGYIFEPGNHEDLANRIIQTISNEKMMKKFSKNSKKLAKEHNIEKTIDRLEKIYREIIISKLN
jgi:glycosyltransferase involved in cell wall biosynthesis